MARRYLPDAVASATPGRFLLTGAGRLRERPVGELVEALRSAGAAIEYAGAPGHLPLAITGGSLRSGRIAVDASRSSQFLSALLLAALDEPVTLTSGGERRRITKREAKLMRHISTRSSTLRSGRPARCGCRISCCRR